MVTGGAGFIGSALVRQLLLETECTVVTVDKLTYAGNLESLGELAEHERHRFVQSDIGDRSAMARAFAHHAPDAVIHLAAESHVDRSIDGPDAFVETNVVGTSTLLEAAREHWRGLDEAGQARFRFHHVSTDEVYGDLGPQDDPFTESHAYRPSSPYAASKAASDHFARAWYRTYGLPVVITNCSNNYGPRQFPEKLIPFTLLSALEGQPLRVYGRGNNVRDWLFVEDHARALRTVLEHGRVGETYNIGARAERTNLEVVESLCDLVDELSPRHPGAPWRRELIRFVEDRPGHDWRYAIDATKVERELGWSPRETLESGLRRTVEWYLENREWCRRVQDGSYRGERLGTVAAEGS